jgi:hypothetical protein
MTVIETAIFLGALVIAVFIIINGLDLLEKRAKNTWKVVAEGIYTEAIQHFISSKIATKMTGYYAKLPSMIWTTLVFLDGTRIKVVNIEKLPPPGTYIKVLENKRAEFRIDTA